MSVTRTMVSVFVTAAVPVLALSVTPLATQPFLDVQRAYGAGDEQFRDCVSGQPGGVLVWGDNVDGVFVDWDPYVCCEGR